MSNCWKSHVAAHLFCHLFLVTVYYRWKPILYTIVPKNVLVCPDALCHSQQFFSHVKTFTQAEDKSVLLLRHNTVPLVKIEPERPLDFRSTTLYHCIPHIKSGFKIFRHQYHHSLEMLWQECLLKVQIFFRSIWYHFNETFVCLIWFFTSHQQSFS